MSEQRWSAQKANDWYNRLPWLVGCNFIPSTAINQLEMWQKETFDLATMQRELGWAAAIGFNCIRVFLHDVVYQIDPEGFKERIDQFLETAYRNRIRTAFVFFTGGPLDPKVGKQPDPIPGVHNSGWAGSPGAKVVVNPGDWSRLESYVKDILSVFAADNRVLMWDLYNEPGGGKMYEKSLPLLQAVFSWARAVSPQQPLTVGLFEYDTARLQQLNDFQLKSSDIITFHQYNTAEKLKKLIQRFRPLGWPVVGTEWMARTRGSRFITHLPIFKQEGVGCISWGLVDGKTQTRFPWGSQQGAPEPEEWFHDIFRKDGTPYDPAEIALIKRLTDLRADKV